MTSTISTVPLGRLDHSTAARASTVVLSLSVHNIVELCAVPRRQSLRRHHCRYGRGFPLQGRRIGQQTHFLVDRPHDGSDFRQFEREPQRAGDAERAGDDDGVGRSYSVS